MTDNLGALLAGACQRFARSSAIESRGSISRYMDLAAAADALARKMQEFGLTTDEPVLVFVANAAQDLVSFIGVWQAGGVVVPVAANVPGAVVETMRAATGARFLVTGTAEGIRRIGDAPPQPRELLEGAALIIFTSGSAGLPKGVVLGHKAFAGKLRAIDSMLNFAPSTRALLVLQMTFVFGIWVSLLTLMKGGTLLMHPRFEALAALTALAEQRITDAAFVPTMLRKMLSLDRAVYETLRARIMLGRILTGGEPFGRELSRQVRELLPNAGIADIYGLTETASSDFFCTPEQQEKLAGTIGFSSPGVRFRIADENGTEVPPYAIGELQIQTPFIMAGYIDDPALTRAVFAGGFFRTGDLARLREDGAVELAGRSKDLIVRGGTKIAPLELDNLLAQHPAVAAALTAGVPDAILGERVHALVVTRVNAKIDEAELRDWVAARIERYKRPDVYHFGAELPVGRTGKVDRNVLRALVRDDGQVGAGG